jgi:hypothetical protein
MAPHSNDFNTFKLKCPSRPKSLGTAAPVGPYSAYSAAAPGIKIQVTELFCFDTEQNVSSDQVAGYDEMTSTPTKPPPRKFGNA